MEKRLLIVNVWMMKRILQKYNIRNWSYKFRIAEVKGMKKIQTVRNGANFRWGLFQYGI